MADFAEYDALKAELADMDSVETKDRRKSVLLSANNLDGMVDEVIDVFKQLHPLQWIEFEERIKEKRSNSTKFGEPTSATADEKNMELRSELWMPSVAIEYTDLHGTVRSRHRDLKSVVAAIYKKHGFQDFPNPQNHPELLMLKDFKRRFPVFFIADEL